MNPLPLGPIRVYDLIATVTPGEGVTASTVREWHCPTETTLALINEVGMEGFYALVAYLNAMQRVPVGDQIALVVPSFSARWLQTQIPIGRNAAARAQTALEKAGYITRIVLDPSAGNRGTSRGVISPQLAYLEGAAGSGEIDESWVARKGRPRGSLADLLNQHPQGTSPETGKWTPAIVDNGMVADSTSPETGNTQVNAGDPVVGNWEGDPVVGGADPSRFPGSGGGSARTDHGPGAVNPQVNATSPVPPDAGQRAPLVEVVQKNPSTTRTSDQSPQWVAILVQLAVRDPERTGRWLAQQLNDRCPTQQWEGLVRELGCTAVQGPEVLARLCVALLVGQLDPVQLTTRLGVNRRVFPPAPQLAQQLAVGFLAGVTASDPVKKWGAWMHMATDPSWEMRTNARLDQVVEAIVLRGGQSPRDGAGSPPPRAATPSGDRQRQHGSSEPAGLGDILAALPSPTIPDPTPAAPAANDEPAKTAPTHTASAHRSAPETSATAHGPGQRPEGPYRALRHEVTADDIARHVKAARTRFPSIAPGERWDRVVVRMYLDELDHRDAAADPEQGPGLSGAS